MTPQQLKTEVETGPLAAALAPFWAGVFPAEPEPPAPEPPQAPPGDPAWAAYEAAVQSRLRWERIRGRAGTLTPDAAYGVLAVLGDGTRRSRPAPMPVGDFAVFLAGRGLLRPIKEAAANPLRPPAVRDVCDLVATLVTASPDRVVDPASPAVRDMMGTLVAGGLVGPADWDAWLAACRRPCSRLAELGWAVSAGDLQAARALP